jgi:acyl-coenzyme A synthetase/AMP-(fatty) acid ligase
VKTWKSLVVGAESLGRQLGMHMGPPRAVVGTVPPQHMYGLETTVLLPLQWGCMVHTGRPVLPADLRAAVASLPVPRWLVTTPLHLRACLAEGVALPVLEGMISATMPLLPELARNAESTWRIPIHEIYGCTEGGMIAMRRTAACETWKVCQDLRIWKNASGVWVEGGHVAHPLRLEDRISVHSEQEFLLHGPANDLVKIGGKRASLQALNNELNRIKGVIDGAFYLPDADNGEVRLTAFAVTQGLTAPAILAELRTRIDPVFLPRPLYLVDALPRSSTGKIPRESIRALALSYLPKTAH